MFTNKPVRRLTPTPGFTPKAQAPKVTTPASPTRTPVGAKTMTGYSKGGVVAKKTTAKKTTKKPKGKC